MDQYTVLKQYFGHTAFRPGQEKLVAAILANQDALGIMPTGGGKSLCYQIPALLLPGITLVISPLISLMKDQVAALSSAGIPAAYLNSSQTMDEVREVWTGVHRGTYHLLYVAPERLENPRFLEWAAGQDISLVAVDEAHCISQWGQDFRPSYLKIAEFVASLRRRPVLAAFTATATARVQEDIVQRLGLLDPVRAVTGFDRPNLYFDVLHPGRKKMDALISLLSDRKEQSGIIYCATRASVDKVCTTLTEKGFSVTRYHAGLDEEERRQNQDDFQYDRKQIMAATNAFGMGIDKSNVDFVIHYNMPKNLESYYQEAGRAGRDGEPADCILLYGPGDIVTAKTLITHNDQGLVESDLERLDAMVDYCKGSGCLRARILDYFGQAHPDRCGNCGNCCGEFAREDITVQAQMILSCIRRVRDCLGYYVGATLIIQILRGSRNHRLLDLGLDRLSTYGLMRDVPRERIRSYLECLEAQGYLCTEPEHSTLQPKPPSREVLFHGEKVFMTSRVEKHQTVEPEPEEEAFPLPSGGRRPERAPAAASGRKPARASAAASGRRPEHPPAAAPMPVDKGLLAALKEERARLARLENVPAYIVFSNATLTDMAAKTPRSLVEFLDVSGVGQIKAQRYGEEFLAVIERYLEE